MRRLVLMFLLGILLVSCLESYEFMAARFVRPEEVRRYKPKGALVFGVVDKENAPFVKAIFMMLKKSQDITFVPGQDFSVFVFDVSKETEGFKRIGLRYFAFGIDFWMNEELNFKLEENKVNYLGRFIFYPKDAFKTHRMVWTNLIEEDVKNLADFYPDLTNMEVVPVDIREGVYYFY